MKLQTLRWYLLLSIGIGLPCVLLNIYPYWPVSLTGWLIVVLAGPPMLLALELVGEMIFSGKISRRISDKKFSAARIAFALIIVLIYFGLLYGGWSLLKDFLKPHFS